jgi:hypothetical protein
LTILDPTYDASASYSPSLNTWSLIWAGNSYRSLDPIGGKVMIPSIFLLLLRTLLISMMMKDFFGSLSVSKYFKGRKIKVFFIMTGVMKAGYRMTLLYSYIHASSSLSTTSSSVICNDVGKDRRMEKNTFYARCNLRYIS